MPFAFEKLKPDRHEQLKADLEEIARMLSGLIRGLKKRDP
jgi:hypothetical protein